MTFTPSLLPFHLPPAWATPPSCPPSSISFLWLFFPPSLSSAPSFLPLIGIALFEMEKLFTLTARAFLAAGLIRSHLWCYWKHGNSKHLAPPPPPWKPPVGQTSNKLQKSGRRSESFEGKISLPDKWCHCLKMVHPGMTQAHCWLMWKYITIRAKRAFFNNAVAMILSSQSASLPFKSQETSARYPQKQAHLSQRKERCIHTLKAPALWHYHSSSIKWHRHPLCSITINLLKLIRP